MTTRLRVDTRGISDYFNIQIFNIQVICNIHVEHVKNTVNYDYGYDDNINFSLNLYQIFFFFIYMSNNVKPMGYLLIQRGLGAPKGVPNRFGGFMIKVIK